jgi:CheY-like chemotaxis protein
MTYGQVPGLRERSSLQPDVVVMDRMMPRMECVEATRRIEAVRSFV